MSTVISQGDSHADSQGNSGPDRDGRPGALADRTAERPSGTAGTTAATAASPVAGLLASLVLAAGLGAGLLRQGAFFPAGQWSMGLLVTGALLVALSTHPLSTTDLRPAPMLLLLGIGGWALADGALHTAVRNGLRTAWLVTGIVAVLAVCRRLDGPHRRVLLGGVVTAAVLVAAAGWAGVAYRTTPWGLDAQGLWRASSTLTYPNAAAAVLVPVSLLAVAARLAGPGARPARGRRGVRRPSGDR